MTKIGLALCLLVANVSVYASSNVVELVAGNFKQALDEGKHTLVQFYAPCELSFIRLKYALCNVQSVHNGAAFEAVTSLCNND